MLGRRPMRYHPRHSHRCKRRATRARSHSELSMQKHAWLLFVLGAALSWGAYVPTIHHGQLGFPQGANRALKAFLFVGLAYFLVAVLVPGGLLVSRPDAAGFS